MVIDNKKYLVVCGDSFTEGHMIGETASWAYWVAKDMNLNLINLSCGGMGNEWIATTILTFLTKNEIPLEEVIVMIAWSDLSRQMVYFNNVDGSSENNIWNVVPGDLMDGGDTEDSDILEMNWIYQNRKSLYPFFSSLNWCLFRTYQSLFNVKLFLKSSNIPFLFFDTITDNKIYYNHNDPYLKDSWKSFWTENLERLPLHTEPNIVTNMLSEEMVGYLFDKNYIDIDGCTIMKWLHKPGNEIFEKGNDGHLNEIGSKVVSKKIINKFKKIYEI